MTQAQQAAVQAAQAKFFAAEAAAKAAQSIFDGQNQAYEDSKINALVTVPNENKHRLEVAQGDYLTRLANLPAQSKVAQDAWSALGQARIDAKQAIDDAMQQGGAEWIPPNIAAPGTGGQR